MISPLKKVFATVVSGVLGFGAGAYACAYVVSNDAYSEVNLCMADKAKASAPACAAAMEEMNRDMLKSSLTGMLAGGAGAVIFINRRNRKELGPK